jgi:hypothetical protein
LTGSSAASPNSCPGAGPPARPETLTPISTVLKPQYDRAKKRGCFHFWVRGADGDHARNAIAGDRTMVEALTLDMPEDQMGWVLSLVVAGVLLPIVAVIVFWWFPRALPCQGSCVGF